jgi:hypothetical protein
MSGWAVTHPPPKGTAMWDIGMQPSLAASAATSPEIFSMLILVFVVLVGLAAALVILEAVHFHRSRKLRAANNSPSVTPLCDVDQAMDAAIDARQKLGR